jgi:3-hydroxybutyryl-CoA dehydrogenase
MIFFSMTRITQNHLNKLKKHCYGCADKRRLYNRFVRLAIITVFRSMQVVVLTNDSLQEELLSNGIASHAEIIWVSSIEELKNYSSADAYIDLLYASHHLASLEALLPKIVVINSVEHPLSETNAAFTRINGWPTFLKAPIIEAAGQSKEKAEELFAVFNKKITWLPDAPGFVTPRVISMIINEAYMALEEGISTKQEIDTAMKLGTNYPYGPFEWADKIGMGKINSLLQALSTSQPRYTPAPLLQASI